jgi:hypothetical protein
MGSRRLAGVAVVLALALGLPAAALALTLRASATTAKAAPPATADSHTTAGVREVGALFSNATTDQHHCTASVVASPHGDVIMTAAHCISGSGAGVVFVPEFHDGRAPYGRWEVTGAYLAPGWLSAQDPQEDYAFLTVAPQQSGGQLKQIQQVTGGYTLGSAPNAGTTITVPGYLAGTDNDPITCTTDVYLTSGYPSFDCSGYVAGTSGSPWLVTTKSGTRIVGIIGGLNQGGCYAYTSYSPKLTSAARTTYDLASDHATTDVAPVPDADGCS